MQNGSDAFVLLYSNTGRCLPASPGP